MGDERASGSATWSAKCQGYTDTGPLDLTTKFPSPYTQIFCGLNNLRNKVDIANPRFRLAIWARPRSVGSSAGHTISAADPSLPTTEGGISGRDGKNIQENGPGANPNFEIKDSNN